MFNHRARKKMSGIKEFAIRRLELVSAIKGKNAWTSFTNKMKLEQYEVCNDFTRLVLLNRKQLQR